MMGGVVSAGVGYLIGYTFYNDDEDEDVREFLPVGLAVFGFFVGFILCRCILQVIASAVIALFVCYAEDPASMFANRPEEYQRLLDAKPTWGDVYTTYGGARVQQVGPVMTVAPAQPVVYVQQQPQPQQTQQVVYQQVQQQPQQQQVVYQQPQQTQQVVNQQAQQQGVYPQIGQQQQPYQPPN